MHELSIMRALFEQLEDLARKHGASRVIRLEVEVGAFSNVVPELLQEAFKSFRQIEPLLAQADMDLKKLPLVIECRDCGDRFSPSPVRYRCPLCGSGRTRTVQGEELLLRDVEMEIPDPQPETPSKPKQAATNQEALS
ncbi:MAG TPA: hydrogenase maturation nickel metallochaperone HypA [Acidobacteriota bacterium]|nr:hydrogenase maturation nickel metallochaperone HypA [Acidobacteriota bacterium]